MRPPAALLLSSLVLLFAALPAGRLSGPADGAVTHAPSAARVIDPWLPVALPGGGSLLSRPLLDPPEIYEFVPVVCQQQEIENQLWNTLLVEWVVTGDYTSQWHWELAYSTSGGGSKTLYTSGPHTVDTTTFMMPATGASTPYYLWLRLVNTSTSASTAWFPFYSGYVFYANQIDPYPCDT